MNEALPLDGYRVVDLGRGQASSMASLYLQYAGASVVRLDDASGVSPLDRYKDMLWNKGKQRHAIDSSTAEGRNAIMGHLAEADILIHDRLPEEAGQLGIDAASLDAGFPTLVHVAIGGWPAGHRSQDMPVDDALVMASAGLFDEQAAVRRDGPVWLRFPLGSNLAAYLAAAGALVRLKVRNRTGRGGMVATSLLQGALIPMLMHWSRAERPSKSVLYGMPKDGGATVFECSDGNWIHTMGAPQAAPSVRDRLNAMSGEQRDALNAKYIDAVVQYPGLGKERGAVEAIFATRPSTDWLNELWEADVSAQPALPMGALYDDEQAIANGYIVEVHDAKLGTTRQPGSPFEISRIATPVPEETAGDPASEAGMPGKPDVPAREPRYPLEGLRVLDIGNFLAGPIAPMLLGDLGADVVKLEALNGDPLRPVEWAFNGCQRSKRSIAVDLKSSEGRDVMTRLVDWADVVHHNQRMPAAQKLGFDWQAVHDRNPEAIYCHVSSYGPKGPRRNWPGYDQLFQAASGWEFESAGQGNPPSWSRFGMIDHLGGLASLVALLAALVRRDATGQGEFTAASLLGASSATLETLVLPDGQLSPLPVLDSEQMGIAAAQRLFKCRDEWIAVSDATTGSGDEIIERLGGSKALEDRLSVMSAAQALALLQDAGIPSVSVAIANRDAFFDDPSCGETRLKASVDHSIYGAYEFIGSFWNFGDLDVRLDRPIPLLGEHSATILSEAGFSGAQSAELLEKGIVAASGEAVGQDKNRPSPG